MESRAKLFDHPIHQTLVAFPGLLAGGCVAGAWWPHPSGWRT